MSLTATKITTYAKNIVDLPDRPNANGYTAATLKAFFDGRTDEEINTAINAIIDDLATTGVKTLSFYIDDTLEVEESAMSIIAPQNLTITEIKVAVSTAPTGANLVVDVNKNGTTVYTTQDNRPTVTAGDTSATATDPDVTSISAGDVISIDIDQIGSTVAGANLSVAVICSL